jgi:hypothetical protein
MLLCLTNGREITRRERPSEPDLPPANASVIHLPGTKNSEKEKKTEKDMRIIYLKRSSISFQEIWKFEKGRKYIHMNAYIVLIITK